MASAGLSGAQGASTFQFVVRPTPFGREAPGLRGHGSCRGEPVFLCWWSWSTLRPRDSVSPSAKRCGFNLQSRIPESLALWGCHGAQGCACAVPRFAFWALAFHQGRLSHSPCLPGGPPPRSPAQGWGPKARVRADPQPPAQASLASELHFLTCQRATAMCLLPNSRDQAR